MFSVIGETMRVSVPKRSKCGSFTMTANWLMLLLLFSSTSVASSSFKKCCPPGEVFSGISRVDCVPAPRHATELYVVDSSDVNVTYGEFPICEKPQDIATVPLFEISPTDFLQKPSCIEILHEHSTRHSVPIFVYCKSDEDRDDRYPYSTEAASLPQLLHVRRCCSNNTIFDLTTGGCEPTFNTTDDHYSQVDDFLSLLPKGLNKLNFLNVRKGLPSCSGAIFTYEIDTEDITFEDGILQVTLRTKDGAENFILNDWNSCLELTSDFRAKRRLVVRVCREAEFCLDHACIKKCCLEEDNHNALCKKILKSNSQLNFYEEISNVTKAPWNATEFGILHGLKCPNGMYIVSANEIHGITPKGNIQILPDYEGWPYDQYCMDVYYNQKRNLDSFNAFVCFDTPIEEPVKITRFVVSSVLEAISCISLLLTLIVYACLPMLQNLHGKTVMCHAASLMMAYACLCIIPWATPDVTSKEDEYYSTVLCAALGYSMLFFFLSTFCWLNVMSFDMWQTFGRLCGNITTNQNHTRDKRFLLYCLYAWGLSMSITVFGILSDEYDMLPEIVRPSFGTKRCWFDGNYSELVFFRGPIAILLTSNIVFFILSAEYYSKVKVEIRRVANPMDARSKRFRVDKAKFIMNVKLFIVMGITWIAEIVSSFVDQYTEFQYQEELFYALDVVNSLQGVLIFVLFVMKPRIHQALKERLGFDTKKKAGSRSVPTPQDPFRVKKSASNSTLTSTCAIGFVP